MSTREHTSYRETAPAMRRFFFVAAFFAFIGGLSGYLFSTQTDRFASWTIAVPLSAAFIGGGYWGGALLVALGTRQRWWAHARIAAPVVWVYSTLALIFTLIHLDRFHHTSPTLTAAIVAWTWIVLYIVVPPLLLAIIVLQERRPGEDPPRVAPLPGAIRIALIISATLLLLVGSVLLVSPSALMPHWAWELTPLTARAVGAWLFAIGFGLAHAVVEDDRQRITIGAKAYAVFAALQIIALLRFPDQVFWSRPMTWAYVAFLLSALMLGLAGWRSPARQKP